MTADLSRIPGAEAPGPWRSGSARFRLSIVVGLTFVALVVAAARSDAADYATPRTARSHPACQAIHTELIAQGASVATADRFAYVIAPRESGCIAQYVHDRDDWSYSRFGLNGKSTALRAGWRRLCGADVRSDTAVLSVDVQCALAAHRAMGWRPWRVTR